MPLTIIGLLNNRMASGERLFLSGGTVMAEQIGADNCPDSNAYEISAPGGIMGNLIAQHYVKSIIRVYFVDGPDALTLEVYGADGEQLCVHTFPKRKFDGGGAIHDRVEFFKAKYHGNPRFMNAALVNGEQGGQTVYFASDTKRQSPRLKKYIATGQLPELTWDDLGTPTNAESPFLERRPRVAKKTWH